MNRIDRYFGVTRAGSTLPREVVGGLTTFATMSYIIFVQPAVLAAAGMDFGSVLVATCLASAFASIVMGLYARFPFALAPGMGQNFLFAFTVCSTFPGGMGFSWQAGLAIVLIAGLIFLALSLFRTRERIIGVLPDSLKYSIGPAIGLFIAFVGLQWGGIVAPSATTMVRLGDLRSPPALMTLAGLTLMIVCAARDIRAGILIGILATTGLGLLMGVLSIPEDPVVLRMETFAQFDFAPLFVHWDKALVAIALVFFLDLFDTVGTLVGVSSQAGYLDQQGNLPRAGRAFTTDALASCFGALVGTSTVTTYIESASGVAAGARTGLAAVVTGLCFIAALVLAPIVRIVGQDVGPAHYGLAPTDLHIAMYPAVAPALVVVGFMMLPSLRKIDWDDVTESFPAFLTIAIMAFGFGITEGIALGCISATAIKLLVGRGRDLHPAMYFIAVALTLRYVYLV